MPSFIEIGGTRTGRQYGEIYTSRTFTLYMLTIWAHCLDEGSEQLSP